MKNFKHLELILLLAIVSFGIYNVRHIFSPGLPMGWDTPGHYLRAKFFSENPDLNGWFPYSLAGHPIFQFKPPLPYVLPSVLNLLPIGFENAFKITMVLFYALLPVAVYFFMRAFGTGIIGSLAGALFSLFVRSFWGAGIIGIFEVGLFTNAPGIILWLITMALIHKSLTHNSTRDKIFASIALAFLILSHLFSTYYFAISLLVYIAMRMAFVVEPVKLLAGVLQIILVAVLLSAFWLFPFAANIAYRGMTGPWAAISIHDVVRMLVDGNISGDKLTTFMGIFGFMLCLMAKRKFSKIYIAGLAAITLLLGAGMGVSALPLSLGIFQEGLSVRFMAFAAVWFAILAGIAMDEIAIFVQKRSKRMACAVIGIVIVLATLTSFPKLESDANQFVKVDADFPDIKHARDAALWIGQNTLRNMRSASEFSWGIMKYGTPHIGLYIPIYSKRNELRGFAENIKTSSGTVQLTDIQLGSNNDVRYLYTELFNYGVGYLLTYKEDTNRKFANNGILFKKTFESDDINIFELAEKPNFFLTSGAEVLSFASFGNGFEYLLKNAFSGKTVSIAVSYYPNWSVYIDGKKGKVFQTEKNLMQVFLDNSGLHKVRFAYEAGLVEKVSMGVSFVAWVSVIYLLLRKNEC